MSRTTPCRPQLGTDRAFSCVRLHEAPAGYFSSVYMTFLSVFQGIALAAIVMYLADALNGKVPLGPYLYRYLPVTVFVLLLWHKYINHHQFIGWQITWRDTAIVAVFGLLEGLMVAWGVGVKNPAACQALLAGGLLWGGVAYLNAYQEQKKDYVLDVFKRHYRCEEVQASGEPQEPQIPGSCGAAEQYRDLMVRYESAAYKVTASVGAVLLFVALVTLVVGHFTEGVVTHWSWEVSWVTLSTALLCWYTVVLDLRRVFQLDRESVGWPLRKVCVPCVERGGAAECRGGRR